MNRSDYSDTQLRVIDSENKRILVSASAGSGKTTVMIERIATLLRDKKCGLGEMLVCTFTKSAASDMRAKLYCKLSAMGLKSMLSELVRADISTIDSFCQKTVKRYFFELGIDPEFEVSDEEESKIMLGEAIKTVVENNAEYKEVSELMSGRSGYVFFDTLKKVCDDMRTKGDTDKTFCYDENVSQKIEKYFNRKKERLKERILHIQSGGCGEVAEIFLKALDNETSLPRISTSKLGMEQEVCVNLLKTDVKAFLSEVGDYKRTVKQESGFIDVIYDAARDVLNEYGDAKKKACKLDFADLEVLMLKLLHTPVAEQLRKKYKYIFVDEYQDINPLQEQLITLLSGDSNLFMVGDLKQSIYAFRGCEPRIFKAKYESYKATGEGEVIDLDDNYRSSPQVINAVNKVFCEIMTDGLGGTDYAKNPMKAKNEQEGEVVFNVISPRKNAVSLPKVYSVKNHVFQGEEEIEAEAIAAVNLILDLISKEGASCYGDIAVLSRDGTSDVFRDMMRMLKELNIPFSVKEQTKFIDDAVIGQLIAYLKIIDNFLDDKALAVAMLSPLGGFTENELAAVRANGDGRFCELVLNDSNEKVVRFKERADRYRNMRATCTAGEMANAIVAENGYFNYAYAHGDDCAELLDKFLEYLTSLRNKDLYSALNTLAKSKASADKGEIGNTIKFMTIHKSKGLEFKYVLIVGLSKSFNFDDLSRCMIGDGMYLYSDHSTMNTDMRFYASVMLRKQLLEENLRILYVAMTRAKKGLYLFATAEDGNARSAAYELQWKKGIVDLSEATCFYDWLSPLYALKKRHPTVELFGKAKAKGIGAADERLIKMLNTHFDMPYLRYAPSKSYVSLIAHAADEEEEESIGQNVVLVDDGEDAMERGNAYHRAMQKLDFSNPDFSVLSDEDIRLIDKKQVLDAIKNVGEFVGVTYKEQPFMIKKAAKSIGVEGEGDVLVQGVIDLLVIDGDNAVVVDYKTGKPHSRFEEGYFKQVNLYGEAVETLLKLNVRKKCLYYFSTGEFVEVK